MKLARSVNLIKNLNVIYVQRHNLSENLRQYSNIGVNYAKKVL
jgi:hypothetical protein